MWHPEGIHCIHFQHFIKLLAVVNVRITFCLTIIYAFTYHQV